jgi:proline iminopeptidase
MSLAVGAYAFAIRPRLLRWGATVEEMRRPYPGADLIPGGTRSSTMAVTIDAPPACVWPWLVQMGYGRAGWYSWDHLDNLGRPSAERLHPEWQDIRLGDFLAPDEGVTARSWEVAALEPERFLGLRASYDLRRWRWFDPVGPRPPFSTLSLWGFLLQEVPGGRARLVVSGYWSLRPRWLQPILSVLLLEPTHWIMQTRQLANLKRRVVGTAVAAPATLPATGSTAAPTAMPCAWC